MRKAASLGVAFVAAHACVIALAGPHAMAASYAVLALAPLLALAAAFRQGVATGPQANRGWLMVAVAFLLWTLGMAASARQDLLMGNGGPAPYDSMLFYELYAIPLAWVIATPASERAPHLVRGIDAVLACVLGALFYLYTRAVAHDPTLSTLDQARHLVWLFDVENVFLLLCATARRWGADAPRDRRFFTVLVLYLAIYALVAAINNHGFSIALGLDVGGYADLLLTAPFLLFAAIVAMPPDAAYRALPLAVRGYVRSASPLSMCAALLGLSLVLIRTHYAAGVVGVLVAVASYAVRSVFREVGQITEHAQLEDDRSALQTLAVTDALTGVGNRRAFDAALEREVQRSARTGRALGLLMIDIDHFKRLNDTLGHPCGDDCLRRIARTMQDEMRRPSDVLARYGGEEFVVLLPDTDLAGSSVVAEALRSAVERARLPHPDVPLSIVTVSVGAATWTQADGVAAGRLVARADAAVYEAKRGGRNRVARSSAPDTLAPMDRVES